MHRTILPLIRRKRDGHELSHDEIREFVSGVTSGDVPDYQLGAMLMAIYLRGMSDRETTDLTVAMAHSGDVLDLSSIPGFKVDKHSTGGVGDKVTPVLGPLVASAGVYFPKLSGRGLGHTGGTLDKLEAIPGFRVDLGIDEFIDQVREIGLAIAGQSAQLVPADGVLYSLRDVTATVDSVPLIASSVMSKKIAAGADGIVLDVKCGGGAFMQTADEALVLARLMVAIGSRAGKRTLALVTDMNEPLGLSVGNALEIREAISTLRGEPTGTYGQDLREVCILLGSQILVMAGIASTVEEAETMLIERIKNGSALQKFRDMVRHQGGDPDIVDDVNQLPRAREQVAVPSPHAGYVQSIQARLIGDVAMELGAGRKTKGESVDPAVGIELKARVGDRVEKGEAIATLHTNHRISNSLAVGHTQIAYVFGPEPPDIRPHVLSVVSDSELERR